MASAAYLHSALWERVWPLNTHCYQMACVAFTILLQLSGSNTSNFELSVTLFTTKNLDAIQATKRQPTYRPVERASFSRLTLYFIWHLRKVHCFISVKLQWIHTGFSLEIHVAGHWVSFCVIRQKIFPPLLSRISCCPPKDRLGLNEKLEQLNMLVPPHPIEYLSLSPPVCM